MKKINKKLLKKKELFPFIAVVCIALVLIFAFVLSDKKLDLDSNKITTLYKYLGEVDVYHCGGLLAYSDSAVTKAQISQENMLCMAFYNLDNSKVSNDKVKSFGVNKNDIKICKVGENTTLATDNDEDFCNYKVFKKEDLNNSFKEIYGEKIQNYDKFYISSSNACFLEGDSYYCGIAETFTYSLTPQATIYRLLYKAVEKINGDIVIYDYFLKASDNKCYLTNNTSDIDKNCTEALERIKNDEIDVEFVKKYGSIFKHTFKKNSNGNYYWLKSELK